MTAAEFQTAFDQHKDAVYRWYPDRFDPARGTLRAFLLGIARNLTLKHWRAEHRFEPLDDEAVVAEPVDLGRGRLAQVRFSPSQERLTLTVP